MHFLLLSSSFRRYDIKSHLVQFTTITNDPNIPNIIVKWINESFFDRRLDHPSEFMNKSRSSMIRGEIWKTNDISLASALPQSNSPLIQRSQYLQNKKPTFNIAITVHRKRKILLSSFFHLKTLSQTLFILKEFEWKGSKYSDRAKKHWKQKILHKN